MFRISCKNRKGRKRIKKKLKKIKNQHSFISNYEDDNDKNNINNSFVNNKNERFFSLNDYSINNEKKKINYKVFLIQILIVVY